MTGFRSSGSSEGRPGRSLGTGKAGPASPFTQVQILQLMKNEFARARRYGHPVSCLLLQVDRLQSLADMHGSELRELVREKVAQLVTEKTRGHDYLGLISEERFLLLLPHTDGVQASTVAERIRQEFAELEVTVAGGPLALTLSQGIATCDDDTLFFDTILSRAEVALQWASEAGGGTTQVFEQDRFAES
ncbi:MAG: GGDEF domain-containing protein [Planctomycetota bacterium]